MGGKKLKSRFQMSGVRCQVSDVRCQVSGVRCQMSDIRYQISDVRKNKGKETAKAENKRAFRSIWFLYAFAFADNCKLTTDD